MVNYFIKHYESGLGFSGFLKTVPYDTRVHTYIWGELCCDVGGDESGRCGDAVRYAEQRARVLRSEVYMIDEVTRVGAPADCYPYGQQGYGQDGPSVVKVGEGHQEHRCPHLA